MLVVMYSKEASKKTQNLALLLQNNLCNMRDVVARRY